MALQIRDLHNPTLWNRRHYVKTMPTNIKVESGVKQWYLLGIDDANKPQHAEPNKSVKSSRDV